MFLFTAKRQIFSDFLFLRANGLFIYGKIKFLVISVEMAVYLENKEVSEEVSKKQDIKSKFEGAFIYFNYFLRHVVFYFIIPAQ